MTESEFDKKLREKLDTYTEAAPDVWEGIAAGVAARRRRVVFRRVSFAVAAAAACLVAGILIFRNPVSKAHPEAPVQTAQVQPAPSVEPAAPDMDIAPIAEQAAAFTKNRTVAAADIRVKVRETIAAEPEQTEVSETPETSAPVVETAAPEADQTTVTTQPEAQAPETQQLGQEDLPGDFWTRPEADETPARNAHTSQLSILSNLTAVASEKNLLYGAGSNHSSSQTGSKQAASQFEPATGTAKFSAPVSLGLQIKTRLANHLYVGTGISYSYLVSQYDLLVNKELKSNAYNQLHYLGIPLTLSYNFVETPSLGVYASVGGMAEKCVAQRYIYTGGTGHDKVSGLQWSASAGLGVEYWFIPRLGIYFDPSLVYFFDNSQPLSIRTQQPLQARFEAGFRFKI